MKKLLIFLLVLLSVAGQAQVSYAATGSQGSTWDWTAIFEIASIIALLIVVAGIMFFPFKKKDEWYET